MLLLVLQKFCLSLLQVCYASSLTHTDKYLNDWVSHLKYERRSLGFK